MLLPSLVHFIKMKCDGNLKSIRIRGNFELADLGKQIEVFLRNVENVTLCLTSEGRQDEAVFLKYCPSLRKLKLYGKMKKSSVDAILRQQYPHLTQFIHNGPSVLGTCAETLNTFFRTNDKIEIVGWEFILCAGNKRRNYRAYEYIKALDHAVNLKKLLLAVGGSSNCFYAICSHLNVLYDRGICKLVEFDFDCDEGFQLLMSHGNHLKYLTSIQLTLMTLSTVMPVLRSMIHLKVITLVCLYSENGWGDWTNLDDLIAKVDSAQYMSLPQVEEVQFVQFEDSKALFAYAMLFARHSTNLKRMLVPFSDVPDDLTSINNLTDQSRGDTKFLIPELNQAREELKDACELIIFTDHKGNATNVDHKLVKLKVVKFEQDYDRDSFQRYFIKSSK